MARNVAALASTSSMWRVAQYLDPNDRFLRARLLRDERTATWAEVLAGLVVDDILADTLDALVRTCPFASVRWETPPVTSKLFERVFECALIDSPELTSVADSHDFAEHFKNGKTEICVFPNLGGDAKLIAPRPLADTDSYSHLSAFCRGAARSQRRALWHAIGSEINGRLGNERLWANTAGAGVPWLHVRLDSLPKYYQHAAYRRAPSHD